MFGRRSRLSEDHRPEAAPPSGRRARRAAKQAADPPVPRRGPGRFLRRLILRMLLVLLLIIAAFGIINPPTTWTILTGQRDHPGTPRQWTPIEEIAPVMIRSVVAAEDANFCRHWGFDMTEIRKVIAAGSSRGASTISQQVSKNVFLWQERSWPRKALETALTPLIEALWSKRRIVEVYLNVAEFGPGVFGIHAAAARSFDTSPDRLSAVQAARLAAVLPAPKERSASDPGRWLRARAASIADGAATIARDGRDDCLELD